MQLKPIQEIRNHIYFSGLMLMLLAMPLSKALLSISLFILVLAWFIAPGLKTRILSLKNKKSVWIFISGILIVVFGLFYSENLNRNVFLIFNIKVSLILLPLIISSFPPLSKKELNILLIVFTVANFIACIVSTLVLFQIIPYEIKDVREISIFIESIRFALLLVLNILILAYALYHAQKRKSQIVIVSIIVFFIFFLNLMQALTGILALLISSIVVMFVYGKKIKVAWKFAFAILFLTGILIIGWLYSEASKCYYAVHSEDLSNLDSVTINGNPYIHQLDDSSRVNGYFINIYVCEKEIANEWKKVSERQIDSFDARGWVPLKTTLISYISSKGLRKDSVGFSKLTKRDIKNIENGFPNAALAGIGLKSRMYDIIREFDSWEKTGKPDGSITIRINAMLNGWKVFRQHPFIGTGYGDINDDIQKQFEKDNKIFGEPLRQNPHNQFFTVLIGSGVIGFVVFLFSLIVPGIIEKKYHSYLFLISFCVVILSFLSDDTLERMIGCVITGLFFSLFLYAVPDDFEKSI